MTDLPPARALHRKGSWTGADDRVILGYDARFLRRKRLETEGGAGFLVDLPETVSVEAGDAFGLEDGRRIEVVAAEEPVLVITGDLPRLAWHIGNRHTPCQIGPDRLTIRQDHVLEAMLRQLGATVTTAVAPFTPEGGAYGQGRTMGHDHGPGEGHLHVHTHGAHHHPEDEDEPEREPE
jgi:urease accessory protein